MKKIKGAEIIDGIEKIATVLFTILICSLSIPPLSRAEVFQGTERNDYLDESLKTVKTEWAYQIKKGFEDELPKK